MTLTLPSCILRFAYFFDQKLSHFSFTAIPNWFLAQKLPFSIETIASEIPNAYCSFLDLFQSNIFQLAFTPTT
jgi:hypothetical protein